MNTAPIFPSTETTPLSTVDTVDGIRSDLRIRLSVANEHTNQVDQVGNRQGETISVDIGSGDLTVHVDREGTQTYDEVVGEHDGVGDFVRQAVQVDVTASVDRVGADDVNTAVEEVDRRAGAGLPGLTDIALVLGAQIGRETVRLDR